MSGTPIRPDFLHIDTGTVRLRVAVTGSGPLVVLVHGFPESWYSWRHQMQPLAQAGFRVAAPDLRGYGGSDCPPDIEAYDQEALIGDVAGLVRALSPREKAVLVGHDIGAPTVWQTALRHPDLIRAVAGLSVPHMPPGDRPMIDEFEAFFGRRKMFFYQLYFQEPGVAEREMEADIPSTIRKFYYALSGDAPHGTWPQDKVAGDTLLKGLVDPPAPLPWLTDADIAYLAGEFSQSGFRGPINRYRNHRRDFAFETARQDHRIHQPSLFIGGTKDLVLKARRADMVETMRPLLTYNRGIHLLEGCGHWTQQERPDDVNALLLPWLNALEQADA